MPNASTSAPTFDSFLAQAWNDHAADPHAVAVRLQRDGPALAACETQLTALAGLAQHLWGEHLADCDGGIAFLQSLGTHRAARGAARDALCRSHASLLLTASDADGADATAGHGAADRVRIVAAAAANLAGRDSARAGRLLQLALDEAAAAALPAADPSHRALAVAGNNIASALEQAADRNAGQRALMILAAQAARRHWAITGGWLETERADYRLAMTWLQAGDAAQAQQHAQACLDTVLANGAAPLEAFFAHEALALTAQARGDAAAHQQALAQAAAVFNTLPADDQGWCRDTLNQLQGLPAA